MDHKNDNQSTEKTKIKIEKNINKETEAYSTASIKEVINNILKALRNKMKTNTNVFFKFLKEACYKKEIEEWHTKENKDPTDDDIIDKIMKEKITSRIINTLIKFKEQYPDKFNKICFRVIDGFLSLHLKDQGDNLVMNLLSLNDFMFHHVYPSAEPLFKNIDNQIYGITILKSRRNSNYDTDVISASYGSILRTPKIEFRFKKDKTSKINEFTICAKEKNDSSILKFHLNENEITEITKYISIDEGDEYKLPDQPDGEALKQELKKILFGDEKNQDLTKNLERELDTEQKEVFKKKKKYLDIVEEEKKEENKEEEKKKKEETGWKCCDFDLSYFKSCKGIFG